MKTIHIIANAHLDPVWLWPWTAGLDEALGTCRSACDLLDEHKDYIFTAGEAWRYRQIEKLDPRLFQRIKRHVKNGRWEIVNGWWIQPDCNFPSGFALEKQIAVGKHFMLDRFGFFPAIGYNVDSFGHAATLPGFMRAAGQKYYIMMRPQEHEKKLPARLFRWRGFPGTPEVTTFRIAGAYCSWGHSPPLDHIKRSVSDLPAGIEHTMCFVGVGDHGGGPTVEVLEWIRKNRDIVKGWRMVFSSPSRFFRAIRPKIRALPLVTGELQMHAVGCFTVQRALKTSVRRAEHKLRQAELVVADSRGNRSVLLAGIEEGWQRVAFCHFHDILGGTCIPSAYRQLYDQLGSAACMADDIIQYNLRRRMVLLPDDEWQRIVLMNVSDMPFDGYVEHEPWNEWRPWHKGWRLQDRNGNSIPCQVIAPESLVMDTARLLFRVKVPLRALRVIRLDRTGKTRTPSAEVEASNRSLANRNGVTVKLGGGGNMTFPSGRRLALPRLDLVVDRTDNWSHNTDRYPEKAVASATWGKGVIADSGPLMASIVQNGRIGRSALRAEWRIYAGKTFIELRLLVHWCEQRKILKMTLPLPKRVGKRRDGIPGASLVRSNNGAELPVRDWTMFEAGRESRLGIVLPDIYALDATGTRLRLTLLRSPIMTHHLPYTEKSPRARIADQGEHEFRLRFFCGRNVTATLLDREAMMMHRPLVAADLTKGMPRRLEKDM